MLTTRGALRTFADLPPRSSGNKNSTVPDLPGVYGWRSVERATENERVAWPPGRISRQRLRAAAVNLTPGVCHVM